MNSTCRDSCHGFLGSTSTGTSMLPWQHAIEPYFPHGPTQEPDVADPNLLDYAIWYAVTNFTRPFPGENRILRPTEFRRREVKERDGH
jgi:hypothetical protein